VDPKPAIHDPFLNYGERRLLLRIARDAILAWVQNAQVIQLHEYEITTNLAANHGAFVTLRRQEELRGCIGRIAGDLPLAKSVRDNAINAASRDPRFPPITFRETKNVVIEVSALLPGETPGSPFHPIRQPEDILIGRDGIYIRTADGRTGVLLPQVAPTRNWDAIQFLEATCVKAGCSPEAWRSETTQLYRFSAQVFREETPIIP